MAKTWTMNRLQATFISILKEYPDGITLLELKTKRGMEFKPGSINILVTKGYVRTNKEAKFPCNKRIKVYSLTEKGWHYWHGVHGFILLRHNYDSDELENADTLAGMEENGI